MKTKILILLACLALLSSSCNTPASHNSAEECQDTTLLGFSPEMDSLYYLCIKETSTDPIEILEKMMSFSFCPMHGPIHHCLSGLALLTAYHNAGGDVDLETAIPDLIDRGQHVPGGACGKWGACGAALSCGMFMSIITDNSPFATEAWQLSNLCTARALEAVAIHGGPRCCKRDSYLSILATIDFVAERLNIQMTKPTVTCSRSSRNQQCIGKACPFAQAD